MTSPGPKPARRLKILRRPTESIRPAVPRAQRRDCQGQLLAALKKMAGAGGAVETATMRPWCSATFVGAQHRIVLRFAGADAARQARLLASSLPEAPFALRGHVVVDAAADARHQEAEGDWLLALAVLTIEDW